MKEGGSGGANTLSGRKLERKLNLEKEIQHGQGYSLSKHDILYNGKKVAEIYAKHNFYGDFLSKVSAKWKRAVSLILLPDTAIYIPSKKKVYIIEVKFQHASGSVDEKLQTCDFKKKQYEKMLEGTDVKVEYIYVLNSFFSHRRYDDVKTYIESVGCKWFFMDEFDLDALGLPNLY